MKLIVAYIQPEKLNDVKQELFKADIRKMSVTNALGCGQQGGYHESYRGVDVEVNLLKGKSVTGRSSFSSCRNAYGSAPAKGGMPP